MTPERMREIRESFGYTQKDWGAQLGQHGNGRNVKEKVDKWERGKVAIPQSVARLAEMYYAFGVPMWAGGPDRETDILHRMALRGFRTAVREPVAS